MQLKKIRCIKCKRLANPHYYSNVECFECFSKRKKRLYKKRLPNLDIKGKEVKQ